MTKLHGTSKQHRARRSCALGDNVHAPVHSVNQVHVEEAGRSEHDLGTWSSTAVGVAAGIVEPAVRLGLD